MFKCEKCEKEYNTDEYLKLKSKWIMNLYPERTDLTIDHGKTAICNCGYVFGKDRFNLKDNLEIIKWRWFKRFKLKIQVSTVFLEIEHDNGMWYETMLFGDLCHDEQWRYKTKEEARQSHEKIVLGLKKKNFKIKRYSWNDDDNYELQIGGSDY